MKKALLSAQTTCVTTVEQRGSVRRSTGLNSVWKSEFVEGVQVRGVR